MKKALITVLAGAAVFLTACFSPTQTTISEYNSEGKLTKTTITSQSVIKSIAESTKDKSIITWESGWAAYLSASTATTQSPTPTFKLGAGKVDKGVITLHKEHKDIGIAQIIKATRSQLSITTQGVSQQK